MPKDEKQTAEQKLTTVNDINTALKTLNKIEDKRDVLRTSYERKDGALKAAKESLEAWLLEEMKRLGLTAFEAPGEGVATVRVKRRFGCADWPLFWEWVIENKVPEMLQKRLLDSTLQTYLDNAGTLPPGISSEAKNVIVVTKRPPK